MENPLKTPMFYFILSIILSFGSYVATTNNYRHEVHQLRIVTDSLRTELYVMEAKSRLIDRLAKLPYTPLPFKVTVTAYTPSPDETDNTPLITASGDSVDFSHVAVSRDLLNYLSFGDTVLVVADSFWGFFVVTDLMNPRYKRRVDVLTMDKSDAYDIGKRRARVWVRLK